MTLLIFGVQGTIERISYAEDLAEAIDFVIQNDINEKLLNVGSGKEITIKTYQI